jgi:ATP synthase protein I
VPRLVVFFLLHPTSALRLFTTLGFHCDPERPLDVALRVGRRGASVARDSDSRSALSIGLEWSTRVTTIGLEFAVPALLGFWLDRWLGSSPWFTVTGAFLGLASGTLHLVRLAGQIAGGKGFRAGTSDMEQTMRNNRTER